MRETSVCTRGDIQLGQFVEVTRGSDVRPSVNDVHATMNHLGFLTSDLRSNLLFRQLSSGLTRHFPGLIADAEISFEVNRSVSHRGYRLIGQTFNRATVSR